jgi:hypothetical protein
LRFIAEWWIVTVRATSGEMKAYGSVSCATSIAGWSSPVARQAHNLKAAGSNPAPATPLFPLKRFIVNDLRGKVLERRIPLKLIRTVLIMPQIVRNLSAQTRKVEKLTSCFAGEFVRKSVRPAITADVAEFF